ncbi:tRNA 2'-phosphotransferase 1, variant 2 [Entomophthora muscae]|uniref:tRNA 2'-phosphotransferase 1, variant 2 n=1 Tax=Entomophthora muscae TaxID=34485 RepID=A0ACC2T8V5_9FUNG|nr:tRNA 2'-phosphotransferase 1, variant 2 [Entomophthora muscae]
MEASKEITNLSHKLSKFLRHQMGKTKDFPFSPNGYCLVQDLLVLPNFAKYTFEHISRAVALDAKTRYDLRQGLPYPGGVCQQGVHSFTDTQNTSEECNCWWIRANQGHSFKLLDPDLEPLLNSDTFKNVIHGTYLVCWEKIVKSGGLKTMNRTHIHFSFGLPGEDGVISGMRKSSEVFIYIDLEAALRGKSQFYIKNHQKFPHRDFLFEFL